MKRLQNAVAALMILGMLGCLGFIVYAGNALNEELGPSALAISPDGRLFVASHGGIHVFSSESQRDQVIDLERLGTTRIPSDLAVRSDGQVLVANPKTATLDVCDLAKGACASGSLGLIGWTPAHLMPGNTFKFALDEAAGRIYIADNGGHRLLIADATGKVLGTTGANSPVLFPNQVRSYAPGELTVADTNHNRIATFDIAGDRVGRVLRTISTAARGIARPERAWPFGMARLPDGAFWVLVARNGMKDADVILYPPIGAAVKRMDLGEDSDPFAIALWKDAVVVADGRNNRLQAFAPDGTNLHDVGGAAFAEELKALAARSEAWRSYRRVAMVAMGAFPVLGIFLLWRMGVPLASPQRAPIARPESGAPPPIAAGKTIWIGIDPKFARRIKVSTRIGIVLLAVFLVLPLGLIFLHGGAETFARLAASPRFPAMALSLIPMVAILGFVIQMLRLQVRNANSMRIGASSQGFHCSWPTMWPPGKLETSGPIAWSDVYFDGRRLLAGARMIAIKTPVGQEMLPRADFEREILTRIPKGNFIKNSELGRRALKLVPMPLKVGYGLLILVLFAWVAWRRL